MAYTVTVRQVAPRWIAAARGKKMMPLLDQAWAFIKESGIKSDGHNIAIYRREGIEAGAGVFEKFAGSGAIHCVATPYGLAASAIHMGAYEKLGEAHHAIRDWCTANGHEIEGTNWEIYGHWEEDAAKQRTDVFYLLRS